jgi:hypothetical protein
LSRLRWLSRRGGGNRPQLVLELRDEYAFDSHKDRNDLKAAYLSAVFNTEMRTRRRPATGEELDELDRIRKQAEARGISLS